MMVERRDGRSAATLNGGKVFDEKRKLSMLPMLGQAPRRRNRCGVMINAENSLVRIATQ